MDQYGFNMVIRPQWGARSCKGFERINFPVDYVVLYHNTETPSCNNKDECCKVLRDLQEHHQRNGLADLHYNFLIGGDGMMYEGRGWFRQPSKCVVNHDYDEKSWAVAYIGNWTNEPIPQEMKTALTNFLKLGVRRTMLSATYQFIPTKDIVPVTAPFRNPNRNDPNRHIWTFTKRGKDGH